MTLQDIVIKYGFNHSIDSTNELRSDILKFLKESKFTPMQKCPVCKGSGKIKCRIFNKKCKTCKGKGIIPMHKI